MINEDISAFAAYTFKKSKNKNNLGLKDKAKQKFKKKKKEGRNRADSIVQTILKATASSNQSIATKNEEKLERKDLIKSLLSDKKESLFEHCNISTKIDNVFFKENDFCKNNSGKINNTSTESKQDSGDTIRVKKKKKKKVKTDSNIEIGDRYEIVKANSFNSENSPSERELDKITEYKSKEKGKGKKLPGIIYSDSVSVGKEVFSWLISPVGETDFFQNCWEQKPLHIKHENASYFDCVCTMNDLKAAIRGGNMYFTRDIDATSYVNGQRKTHNPEGKATPSIVWDFFNSGKSIRLLNPHNFIPKVRLLNSTLQEFFQCFVGANIYLTPAGTQGFAPHYDDIEAFVLQLEGEKLWRLYNPRSPEETLPRESSMNFNDDEIGEPILEVTLKPGDLLYFPRGIIHQAKCLPHVHSLHITVSCYQKNSWADLFEKVFPVALQKAISEDVEFRKGLPIGYLNHLGVVYCDKDSEQRRALIEKFKKLAQKIIDECPLDACVDQLGAGFTHDALPPYLTEEEELYGGRRCDGNQDKDLLNALNNCSDQNLAVKLIRATSVRLVSEAGEVVLYYTTDNTFVYHDQDPCCFLVSTEWAQAIEHLILSYPKFVDVKELPLSTKINKPVKWKNISKFVYTLWQKGLLLFDRPLQQIFH